MLLYRHENGTYTLSSPDGETIVRHLTKEDGEEIIRKRVPEPIRSQILSETIPGFVIT